MMNFLGIDPGKNGAYAVINQKNEVVLKEKFVSIQDVSKTIKYQRIGLACIERVNSMPKQGVKSMFTFGENFGMWQGLLAAFQINYIFATPKRWQKIMIDRSMHSCIKRCSVDAAERFFSPTELGNIFNLKKNYDIADALHLARYAKLIWNK